MRITGGCLCGAVRFEADTEPQFQGRCYCTDCRRLSGSGHTGWVVVPAEAVSVRGETTAYASFADSGNQVERTFCPRCGAGLFGRNAAGSRMLALRVSALDDPEIFAPQMSIYASRAPSWDPPPAGMPVFAEMPAAPEEAQA